MNSIKRMAPALIIGACVAVSWPVLVIMGRVVRALVVLLCPGL